MDLEKRRASQAKYREANREKNITYQRQRKLQLKFDVLAHYGKICAVCGFDDYRALQIDHIADNGAEERRSLGGKSFSGWRFYEWLKKNGYPEGYQTLCANHNNIKQWNRNNGPEDKW